MEKTSQGQQQKDWWYCDKCDSKIGNNVDMDYHDNVEHPDMDNPYVRMWHLRGRPGLSPYD
jgi:hypothetical protein